MKAVVCLVALLALVSSVQAVNWAVLVAGSNQYYNYRHQADICHAYQIVHKAGIKPEHTIVMHYDDIAANSQNPFKGQLFNKPTPEGTPGVDVYAGCQKDYTGRDVNAQNVLNVLTGKSEEMKGIGNGKVLKSGPHDNVFFFYSDHGTVGEVELPVGGPLYATKFNEALKTMHASHMYNKMVVYIEACESGSMFNNLLPPNINIYATSASSPSESSWGCYCPPQDKVNGKSIGSCLGDLYSVNWMEDSDKYGMSRTLADQTAAVVKLTTQSHVMEWGDKSFKNQTIGDFQGDHSFADVLAVEMATEEFDGAEGWTKEELRSMSAVSTYDIPMHLKYYEYLRHEGDVFGAMEKAETLMAELQSRLATDNLFVSLAKTLGGANWGSVLASRNGASINWECLDAVKRAYEVHCGAHTDYSRKYVRTLANLCQMTDAPTIEASLSEMCA